MPSEFLTTEECYEWMRSRNFSFIPISGAGSEGFVALPSDTGFRGLLNTPDIAQSQVVLASELAKWMHKSNSLLWITTWNVFGNDDEYDIVMSFRALNGGSERLNDFPGWLINGTEPADFAVLATVILYMLAFTWEGWILREDRKAGLWLADEVVEWWAELPSDKDAIIGVVQTLMLSNNPPPWHPLRGGYL